MSTRETLNHIERIKLSTEYAILTPELKVLIEFYADPEGLYTNEIARRLKGEISKSTIQKALMRLTDQGLVKSTIGVVDVLGVNHLARISRISGETTKHYVEKLVDAICETLPKETK